MPTREPLHRNELSKTAYEFVTTREGFRETFDRVFESGACITSGT